MSEPTMTMDSVKKSVTVSLPVPEAFDLFTRGISRWWPMATHSVSLERTTGVVIETRTQGAIYEVRDDGEKFEWGRVVAWEPPTRFVMTWHPGRDAETAQEVEVRFIDRDGSTTIELEHRDWEKLGEKASEMRDRYTSGWERVLGLYEKLAERRQP